MLGTLDFTVSEHCMGSLQFLLEHSLSFNLIFTVFAIKIPKNGNYRCHKKKSSDMKFNTLQLHFPRVHFKKLMPLR